MKPTSLALACGVAALGLALMAGCATSSTAPPTPQQLDLLTLALMRGAFRDEGIAKAERLNQDLGQRACSSDQPPSATVALQIETEALASIQWPAGGRYVGDWREGEKLAQSGRGLTWTDESAAPATNGAGCYNCHRISKEEISYGTIGPSLYQYGKIRGVKDVADPATAAIVQYTWAKLWNSKAYSACSNMPRFGHAGLLNEDQLRHLMALLLDPRSPTNQ